MVTGIVRKIDDLGRIVLPKELRQTLNISSGDDFEILTEKGMIILKKYSRLSSVSENIQKLVTTFAKNVSFSILVTTNDKIINYNNEQIYPEISKLIKERKVHINEHGNTIKISPTLTIEGKYIIMPLIINSDLIGAVISFGNEDINQMKIISTILSGLIKSYFV